MRRTLALVLAILGSASLGAAILVVPTAQAADPTGSLQVRSVGTNYSRSSGVVASIVAAGSPATFSLKVVNPGAAAADYRLRFAVAPAASVVATVPVGIANKALVAGADGYSIAAVPAHGSKIVTLKVTPAKTSTQQTFTGTATLATVSGSVLDQATLLTEIKAPAKGHTPFTMLVSSGSGGGTVGGDVSGQTVTGAAIGVNGSDSFKVTLRNDGTATTTVHLRTGFGFCVGVGDYNPNIYAGLTGDLFVNTQYSPIPAFSGYPVTLAKGASKTFQLTLKRVDKFDPPCPDMGGLIWTTTANDDGPRVSVRVLAHPAA
ncbi:MAG TPA: hypothetical protein VFE15_07670 [Marmoricola sp.]|jgi:hypothetical protein|nr:hypothetical protein [Marmoricola sp.]